MSGPPGWNLGTRTDTWQDEPVDDAGILRATSRTFALSIQLLPGPMRAPVEVAYLLARAGDTIADTGEVPPEVRRALLGALRRAVAAGGAAPGVPPSLGDIPEERALLDRLGPLLARHRALVPGDREDVARVVDELLGTMEWELGARGAFPDAATLLRYADGIAGCVGEFWTRLVARHRGPLAPGLRHALTVEGRRYGRGLQLVNVLRDLPRDRARGRDYLPADEVSRDGLAATLARWEGRARWGLLAGIAYAARLPSWSLRAATALPAALGLATLGELRRVSLEERLDPGRVVKVSRGRVKRLVLATSFWTTTRAGTRHLARVR